jgi:hypothetical protein
MGVLEKGRAIGWRGRLLAVIGGLALTLLALMATSAARAGATAVPEKTDIMFIFDTSGSMGGVLNEAKTEIKKVIEETSVSIPNVAYGVASVEDVPNYDSGDTEFQTLSEEEYEADTEKPWHLWQAVTTETTKVEEAINGLSGEEVAHDGGDGPEAYGRALWETDTNPQVGWREGARHEIVLIADNVPHTPNVNEGIPTELQFTEPFNDGVLAGQTPAKNQVGSSASRARPGLQAIRLNSTKRSKCCRSTASLSPWSTTSTRTSQQPKTTSTIGNIGRNRRAGKRWKRAKAAQKNSPPSS